MPHDLFRLADAICTLIGAPVTIEDRHGQLLAFSTYQEQADAAGTEYLRGRSCLRDDLGKDEARQVLEAVRQSSRPILIEAQQIGDRATLPRLAVAVRAGNEFLGTLWAAVVPGSATAHAERVLSDASRSVALHLVEQREAGTTEEQLTSDLMRIVMAGGLDASTALADLGLPNAPSTVLAMAPLNASGDGSLHTSRLSPADRAHSRQRLAASLRVHLTSSVPGTVVAIVDGQIYAIVPGWQTDSELTLEATCRSYAQRVRTAEPMLYGIGRRAIAPTDIRWSRKDADRAVRVLRHINDSRTIARAAAAEAEARVLELRDLASARGDLPSGPYARLVAYDERRKSSMIATVREWLDSHGDTKLAAQRGHVHENTFRYRLRRACEVGGFDREDPRARFELALQLRLFADARPNG